MIRGASGVRHHFHVEKLWVNDNEVVRQPGVSQKPAGQTGRKWVCVQITGKLADIAVRDESARRGILAQRRRSPERRAVDSSEARNSQPHQHSIEQLGIASRASDVESIEDGVLKDVDLVDRHAGVELGSFATDVTDLQRQVSRQLSLNLQIEILNIGPDVVIVEQEDVLRPVCQTDRLQWLRLRHGQDNTRQIRVRCRDGLRKQVHAGRGGNGGIELVEPGGAVVVDSVSGPEYGLILSEPWESPGQTDGGPDVIPIILVELLVGIG